MIGCATFHESRTPSHNTTFSRRGGYPYSNPTPRFEERLLYIRTCRLLLPLVRERSIDSPDSASCTRRRRMWRAPLPPLSRTAAVVRSAANSKTRPGPNRFPASPIAPRAGSVFASRIDLQLAALEEHRWQRRLRATACLFRRAGLTLRRPWPVVLELNLARFIAVWIRSKSPPPPPRSLDPVVGEEASERPVSPTSRVIGDRSWCQRRC